MNDDDFFQKLFGFLLKDNAEEIWLEYIKEYLESGGDVSITYSKNRWGFLHYAAENLFSNVVRFLLESGITVDSKDLNGSTPYLIALDSSIDAAIQEGIPEIDFSIVKILVQYGANTEVCSVDGISRESLFNDYGEKAKEKYYKQLKE